MRSEVVVQTQGAAVPVLRLNHVHSARMLFVDYDVGLNPFTLKYKLSTFLLRVAQRLGGRIHLPGGWYTTLYNYICRSTNQCCFVSLSYSDLHIIAGESFLCWWSHDLFHQALSYFGRFWSWLWNLKYLHGWWWWWWWWCSISGTDHFITSVSRFAFRFFFFFLPWQSTEFLLFRETWFSLYFSWFCFVNFNFAYK